MLVNLEAVQAAYRVQLGALGDGQPQGPDGHRWF
jgi:hypothetical protein